MAFTVAKNGPAMRQIISQEKRQQIIAALKDNPNATQIAREVGCVNYRTVVRLAEGAGIDLTAGKAARGHPRVSPEKHAQIIVALKDNPNAKQVAPKIGGVSHTKVGKIAKAAGITLAAAQSGKRLSKDQRAQIIGALKANPNAIQAARKIGGVSRTTVGKIAKAAGITLTPAESGRQLSGEQRAQIIDALKANPNASKVAKQIGGVSYVVVWKIAKAAGIELTRGKAARDHRPNKVSR